MEDFHCQPSPTGASGADGRQKQHMCARTCDTYSVHTSQATNVLHLIGVLLACQFLNDGCSP